MWEAFQNFSKWYTMLCAKYSFQEFGIEYEVDCLCLQFF